MQELHLGIIIDNDTFDTPFVGVTRWPRTGLPQFNSEFVLQKGRQHPSGLNAVRVVGPSYDLTGKLALVEVRFDPELYRSADYNAAREILERAGFCEVTWDQWWNRSWPWLSDLEERG